MKTKILNLKGTKALNRNELKKVNGGGIHTPLRCCPPRPNGECKLWWPVDQECP